jgi:hypothetical protein
MSANNSNDLRADIRSTLFQAVTLMECIQVALEMTKRKAEGRSAQIDLAALGRFVDEADEEMKRLDAQVSEFLDSELALDPGIAATALGFYANAAHYPATRGQPSVVVKDGGRIAREALADLDKGEGSDD